MAPPRIPTCEPDLITAGETAVWARSFADYRPSDGWGLKYYFAGPDTFRVAGVADSAGVSWTVTLAASDVSAKPAGSYRWRAYAEKGSDQVTPSTLERYELARGTMVLEANFTTANATEQLDFAEQMVTAIEARLLGRTNADLESYGLAGKSAVKIPYTQLSAALGVWKAKLWRVQNPGRSFPVHQAEARRASR